MSEPTLYLFDGSNLFHAGGFADRETLVDLLASYVAARGAEGVVVFDGAGPEREVGPLAVRYAPDADTAARATRAERRERRGGAARHLGSDDPHDERPGGAASAGSAAVPRRADRAGASGGRRRAGSPTASTTRRASGSSVSVAASLSASGSPLEAVGARADAVAGVALALRSTGTCRPGRGLTTSPANTCSYHSGNCAKGLYRSHKPASFSLDFRVRLTVEAPRFSDRGNQRIQGRADVRPHRTAAKTPQKLQRELEDLQLVLKARNGSQAAMDQLLRRYHGFVRLKASSYFLAGGDGDDLVQEGMIGLYKAVRDFRPEKETSFRSFAELCVTRQIITAIKSATRYKHAPLNTYVSFSPHACRSGRRGRLHARRRASRARTSTSRRRCVISTEELQSLVGVLGSTLSSLESEALRLLPRRPARTRRWPGARLRLQDDRQRAAAREAQDPRAPGDARRHRLAPDWRRCPGDRRSRRHSRRVGRPRAHGCADRHARVVAPT